jgi:DNA-directed RNA polymerase omega subunit
MARYTSEAAANMAGNRFDLVLMASHRARELKNGHLQRVEGTDATTVVTALREIEEGKDTKTRSAVKAVLYRLVVILMTAVTARAIFTDSNFTAMLMAGSQFVSNILIYFVLERVWNKITWGKIIPKTE